MTGSDDETVEAMAVGMAADRGLSFYALDDASRAEFHADARAALAVVREREGCRPLVGLQGRVQYRDHHGNVREGVVHRIETTYGFERGLGRAHHIYSIRPPGRRNCHHIGDRDIVAVLPPPPEGEG